MLFNHLRSLDIQVHTFLDTSDPRWLSYQRHIKPMFVMTGDGGAIEKNTSNLHAECVLLQRVFVYTLLTQGVSVTPLKGSEYRDSKIMSFVYEQQVDSDPISRFGRNFWRSVTNASQSLEERETSLRSGIPWRPLQSAEPVPAGKLAKGLARRLSNSKLSHQELFPELLHIFLAHILLVPRLSLKERAQPTVSLPAVLRDLILKSFLPGVFLHLELQGVSAVTVDVQVFATLLDHFLRVQHSSLSSALGGDIATTVGAIWHECNLRAPDLALLYARFPPAVSVVPARGAREERPTRLLPFQHALFDEELAVIGLDIEEASEDEDKGASHLEFNTAFSDTQHWHNHKRAVLPAHLGGKDTLGPVTEWQRQRQLRSEQRFMSKLQWQAETLTGAHGTPLQQIVIPSAAASRKSKGAPPASANADGATSKPIKATPGKKGKKEVVSSADKIRLANQAKKQAKESESNVQWWKDQLQDIKGKPSQAQIVAMDHLMRNKRTRDGWLAVEARLYRVHLELELWLTDPARESTTARDRYTVAIMRMVKELFESKDLFPNISTEDRVLNFDFVKLVKAKSGRALHKWMGITEDPVVWQLRLFGEYVDRSMDSQSDPRVAFKPDAWQRKVLDCLDRNESILVAAPTSAGKTFISYYAMETLLRSSDDDILVYVAPTKALVSQIAAEVYARFRKQLGTKACWAIHTRDYRVHNPQNCQILVTVPEMLATMLLSPPLARTWTPRIKRHVIILDEIHTIGQQEGGAVWEQIILLAPCPLIGLSATIGEPEKFNAWLASVQEAHGFKHTFIHHPHRYSHLRKYTYLLQPGDQPAPFNGLVEYRKTERLRFVHPISMLAFGARSIPPDFSLEAADCLSLYHALESSRDQISFDIDALNPTRFFADLKGTLLKQKDILSYEGALTGQISGMIESSNPSDQDSVLNRIIKKLTDPAVDRADQRYTPPSKQFYANLMPLLSDLHAHGDLPALLFSFDRTACENMARVILDVLEKAEKRWRETNPGWQRKMQQWELWQSKAKERVREAERLQKAKKGDDTADQQDASWEASFNPKDPSPQFSFAGSSLAFSKSELDEEILSLARWSAAPPWVLRALLRGVGVHHGGMNKHYRTLVESLYRSGYLRVVIATGTLALGINAPTKTSVFCGDSPFLTALMYRQCAGRAGRRGFDLLGKVVFYGLAMDRCQRLVLSKLPSLGGNFPLTSTMVLRLFNLLQGSNDAPVARNAIKSILRLPHVTFVSDVGQDLLLHHIRFSIDYLRRAGLLDAQGNPINLCGVAAHLYYTEPSNLALIALLRHGVVHRICNQASIVTAKRDLLLLLCHLFGRRYLPKAYASSDTLKAIMKKSPSIVVLPPLPDDARKVLLEHEEHIKRVFTGYARAYISQHAEMLREDSMLPHSRKAMCVAEDLEDPSPFRVQLRRSAVSTVVRSPFVAISGHGDVFGSVSELASTSRHGLHLNEHAIPSMRHLAAVPGADNDEFALNAYLLDFYTHGQTAALHAANGIRPGDVWYLLQDFTLTLKAIRTGLAQLLQKTGTDAARAETAAEGEPSEIDSGYGTVDPAEGDPDVHDEDSGAESFRRPSGVTDRDWRVFEVLDVVTVEFDEKFHAMWA